MRRVDVNLFKAIGFKDSRRVDLKLFKAGVAYLLTAAECNHSLRMAGNFSAYIYQLMSESPVTEDAAR